MAYSPPLPIRARRDPLRLLALLALLALTGVLVGLASRPGLLESARRGRGAGDLVLIGDLLYRLGEFVQQQSHGHPGVAWYPGYLLSQRGLGIYEREALTATPSPAALLRLGILYSRSGYPDQGQEMLRRAGQEDSDNYALYWALVHLYAGDRRSDADLSRLPSLLRTGPLWLRELVLVDYYRRLGPDSAARAAQETWQAHLNRFGLTIAILQLIGAALILVGGIAGLAWLFQRLLGSGPRHYQSPLRVPWGLWEAAEVCAVLVFLLVGCSLGVSWLRPHLPAQLAGGLLPPLVLLLAYCTYMGVALLIIYRRVAPHPRPWRLLGLRPLPAAQVLWPGLRAYALFCFLMLPLGLFASHHFLASLPPLFQGTEGLPAYLVYVLLVCLVAPVAEEIVFRGFVYSGLRHLFSPNWAAGISALAFAGAHLPAPTAATLVVAVLGFVLARLYERTRSLLPGMVLHALHNALVFAVMVTVMAL